MTVERKRRPGTCERVVYARVLPLSKRDEENGPRKEVAKVEIVKKETRRENEGKTRVCRSYVQKESSISGGGCIYLSLFVSLYFPLFFFSFFLFLSIVTPICSEWKYLSRCGKCFLTALYASFSYRGVTSKGKKKWYV